MRNHIAGSIVVLAAIVACCPIARAQNEAGQGRGRGQAPSPTANLPFDPHDFSGVWTGRGNME